MLIKKINIIKYKIIFNEILLELLIANCVFTFSKLFSFLKFVESNIIVNWHPVFIGGLVINWEVVLSLKFLLFFFSFIIALFV